MRTIAGLLAAGALFLATSAAHALPMAFTATLRVEIGALQPAFSTGSGTGESIPGSGAAIPGDSIPIGFVSRLVDPLVGVFPGFAVCRPGLRPIGTSAPTSFPIPSAPGAQVGSCAPLSAGSLGALVYDADSQTGTGGLLVSAYVTSSANTAATVIPLSKVGVGGVESFNLVGLPASVSANPWTIGAVSVTGGLADQPLITFSDVGFDDRDGTGAGGLKLVTTVVISFGSVGTVPAISSLEIQFAPVPEPGTLALVGVGLAALARRRA